jgi:holliday junction resolvase YEN1
MSGGDYSLGIPDCGSATALALARCGFGDTLLKAAETLHGERLEDFLSTWRQNICNELIHNSRGFLTSRQPHLAAQISTEFPNRDVLHLYVYPLTSYSPTKTPPNHAFWKSREPRIFEISKFCSHNLGWKKGQDIAHRFRNTLWKGVFFRMTSSVAYFSYCSHIDG